MWNHHQVFVYEIYQIWKLKAGEYSLHGVQLLIYVDSCGMSGTKTITLLKKISVHSTSDNVVLIPLFSHFTSAVNICYEFGMLITFLILKLFKIERIETS